jgi:2-succinyl-5-enolpyruvyl-6-hydroxy-3-cyclohexene-1-carboxylate synthase
VVVLGRTERDPDLAPAAARFAQRSGYPLLADPLSGARTAPHAIAHYDALLRDEGFAAAHRPELVIRAGDLPTSKPLRGWLAGLDAVQVAIDPEGAWQDPDGVVATVVAGPAGEVLAGVAEDLAAGDRPRIGRIPITWSSRAGDPAAHRPDPEWAASWARADRTAADAIAAALGADLSEPRVAAELGVRLPPSATLFVASSMPVRDVEAFFPAREDPPRVLSNRGANGIDGTVSSALGVAAAGDGPVVLLIGDVALAHDIGGLLAARRLGLELTIVLLNNDGGGIFHFLPVAGERDAFEEHVATPHGLDFAQAAALAGAVHERVADPPAFRTALDRALGQPGTKIIEVRTDREANLELHRRVADAVIGAL